MRVNAIARAIKTLVTVVVIWEISRGSIPHIVFDAFCEAMQVREAGELYYRHILKASLTEQVMTIQPLMFCCSAVLAQIHCVSNGEQDEPPTPASMQAA